MITQEVDRTYLQEFWWSTFYVGELLPGVGYNLCTLIEETSDARDLDWGHSRHSFPQPLTKWTREVCLRCHDAPEEARLAALKREPLRGATREAFLRLLYDAGWPWPPESDFDLREGGFLWVRHTSEGHLRLQRFLREVFCRHTGKPPAW